MAEDDRTFRTSTPAANRAEMQGLGVGQKEMDAQQAPSREQHATDPQRLEPFDNDAAGAGDDRGQGSSDMGAGAASRGPGAGAQPRSARGEGRSFDPADAAAAPGRAQGMDPDRGRDEAGLGDAGDLGASTPAGVDIHDLGQEDNPEQDWGDESDEAMEHSANHSRRGVKTEAERGQGRKTRQATKDIISRRPR
jgi:hypothetical protein